MTLSSEFGIELEAVDAIPKNLKSLGNIVKMVEAKLAAKV
jgi:acyl carrier protein